jgi:hypothetical protein
MKKQLFDPIFGFIDIDDKHVYLLEHLIFQRLRQIKQLGVADFVFPNANSTLPNLKMDESYYPRCGFCLSECE